MHSTIYFILHSAAILFYKSLKSYIKKKFQSFEMKQYYHEIVLVEINEYNDIKV